MFRFTWFCGLLLLAALAGCSSDKSGDEGGGDAPTAEGAKFVLAQEPAGAKAVKAARDDVKHGDDVVLVGRIGGAANPWVDGLAAFTIVDESLTPCNEREGDTCPVPWDYCCEPEITENSAFIEFVEGGEVIEADAKQLLAVKELQTVVVRGKAQRDEDGNLTVRADGIFVRK